MASYESGNTEHQVRNLCLCLDCGGDRVHHTSVINLPENQAYMELVCPDCPWSEASVYASEIVDLYDEQQDKHAETVIKLLSYFISAREKREREVSNMESYVDQFVEALRVNDILPEDFRRL